MILRYGKGKSGLITLRNLASLDAQPSGPEKVVQFALLKFYSLHSALPSLVSLATRSVTRAKSPFRPALKVLGLMRV